MTRIFVACIAGVGFMGCRDAREAAGTAPGTERVSAPASANTREAVLTSAVSVSARNDSTCALLTSGRVACWGNEDSHNGCKGVPWLCEPSTRPVLLPGGANLVEISGRYGDWKGIDEQGALYCWGQWLSPLGQRGGMGDGSVGPVVPADPRFEPFEDVARREPGWVLSAAGKQHSLKPLRFGVTDVESFSGGCHLDTRGRMFCLATVGAQTGWRGPLPPSWRNRPTFGRGVSCDASQREMRCDYYEPDAAFQGTARASAVASLPATAAAIAVGAESMCATLDDGGVACATAWHPTMKYTDGPLSVAVEVQHPGPVRRVVPGHDDICAIMENGSVKCWRPPSPEQEPPSSNPPRAIPRLANALDLAAGEHHWCAVASDGTVRCWGNDENGQLGNGDPFEDSVEPVDVVEPVDTPPAK